LDHDKVRAALLKASEGITVRIVRLLERLAVAAIRNGSECISLDSPASLPVRAPLLSMEHRRRPEASA
jgi:hypothetical protein